eukprot:scaffold2450_cov401-Prasinococcus_capsulatus_cf.AAC.12
MGLYTAHVRRGCLPLGKSIVEATSSMLAEVAKAVTMSRATPASLASSTPSQFTSPDPLVGHWVHTCSDTAPDI